jgi:hypothetical protein
MIVYNLFILINYFVHSHIYLYNHNSAAPLYRHYKCNRPSPSENISTAVPLLYKLQLQPPISTREYQYSRPAPLQITTAATHLHQNLSLQLPQSSKNYRCSCPTPLQKSKLQQTLLSRNCHIATASFWLKQPLQPPRCSEKQPPVYPRN